MIYILFMRKPQRTITHTFAGDRTKICFMNAQKVQGISAYQPYNLNLNSQGPQGEHLVNFNPERSPISDVYKLWFS